MENQKINQQFREDEIANIRRWDKERNEYITNPFPKIGGRLRLAHEQNEALSIETEIIMYDEKVAVVSAVSKTSKGSFKGIGMASIERDQKTDGNNNGRLSSKQYQYIQRLNEDMGKNSADLNKKCQEMFGTVAQFLSKGDASRMIEPLEALCERFDTCSAFDNRCGLTGSFRTACRQYPGTR